LILPFTFSTGLLFAAPNKTDSMHIIHACITPSFTDLCNSVFFVNWQSIHTKEAMIRLSVFPCIKTTTPVVACFTQTNLSVQKAFGEYITESFKLLVTHSGMRNANDEPQ